MKFNPRALLFILPFMAMKLLCSCGCTSYKDDPVYISDKSDFVRHQDEINFGNGNGAVETLIVGDIQCGLGDPEDFCEPQCTQTRYESCGQGVARSVDDEFVLDFSHSKKAWHNEVYFFSDCYFVDTMTTQIELINSMTVLDSTYYSVSKILPVSKNSSQSIAEFYYVDEIGPIRYVLTNGEVWDRIP